VRHAGLDQCVDQPGRVAEVDVLIDQAVDQQQLPRMFAACVITAAER
jgi:hypothetical protein